MSRKYSRLFALLALVIYAAALPACNTVEGIGEDVEAAGAGVSNASREVRDGDDDN